MFSNMFAAKKEDSKAQKGGSGGSSGLFSGLGIKGKPAVKDSSAQSPPTATPQPAKSDQYVPPTLPVSRPLAATEMPKVVPDIPPPSEVFKTTPEPAKPVESDKGFSLAEATKPKTGLFTTMKTKQPATEEVKVFHSKKSDFPAEIPLKPKASEASLNTDMWPKQQPEAAVTPPREEVSRESVAALQAKLDERRAKEKKAELEEKLERERRAAEEKDRQRFGNPELLNSWVEERLASYSKQLEEKNKKQLELLAEGNKLQEKLANLHIRKGQTVDKQEQAAVEEDYDLAERLNQVIKDMELVIVQTATEIGKNTALYQSYESDKSEIYHSQINFLVEVQGKITEKKTAEEAEFAKFKAEKAHKKAQVEKQLADETARLEAEENRVVAEGARLSEEKEETEGRISQHTGEIQEEKIAAETELVTLEEEIEELERQLHIKRIQRQTLTETIADKEAQILERMAAFQDELMMVELRMNKLEQAQTKAAKDAEALEAAKSAFALECESVEKEAEAMEQRVKLFSQCIEEQKQKQDRLERLAGVRKQYLTRIEEHTKLLKLKQEQLREAEEYAKTVKEAEEDIRHKFVQKSDRLSELEVKIPKLEAEKKTFATAKQYKDAARLASEVKQAITERESLKEEIERVRVSMSEQDQQSSEIERGSLELKAEIDRLQREITEAREGLVGQGREDQASLE